jgi:hypothetical protein
MTFFIKGFRSEIDYRARIVRPVEKPSFPVAVVMQKRPSQSRWVDSIWEPHGVLADPGGAARVLREQGGAVQWLHPGFKIVLHKDEAEGYYLNLSAGTPVWFVMWRVEDEDPSRARPEIVSLSYNEAGRWLDAQEHVDNVPLHPQVRDWLQAYVDEHYRPEPKKRQRPVSFQRPEERGRGG